MPRAKRSLAYMKDSELIAIMVREALRVDDEALHMLALECCGRAQAGLHPVLLRALTSKHPPDYRIRLYQALRCSGPIADIGDFLQLQAIVHAETQPAVRAAAQETLDALRKLQPHFEGDYADSLEEFAQAVLGRLGVPVPKQQPTRGRAVTKILDCEVVPPDTNES